MYEFSLGLGEKIAPSQTARGKAVESLPDHGRKKVCGTLNLDGDYERELPPSQTARGKAVESLPDRRGSSDRVFAGDEAWEVQVIGYSLGTRLGRFK